MSISSFETDIDDVTTLFKVNSINMDEMPDRVKEIRQQGLVSMFKSGATTDDILELEMYTIDEINKAQKTYNLL